MTRDKNREAFPKCSEMFDEAKKLWPELRVIFAEENGKSIGREPEQIPDGITITWGKQ